MRWRDRLTAAWAAAKCPEVWSLPLATRRTLLGLLEVTRLVPTPHGPIGYVGCPPIGSRAFRRCMAGLKRIAEGEHVPMVAHVSVTDQCGYACGRCSNVSRGAPDPPLDALRRLMADLKLAGASSVALTGGEPNLREDLPEVIAAAGEDLAPLPFTSGQQLDAARARDLRDSGLVVALVSLDHHSARVHDGMRGTSGAFQVALDAMEACLSAGLYTAAQTVVEPELLADGAMDRFLQFCGELGVHDVVLLNPVPVGCRGGCAELPEEARRRLAQLHMRSVADPRSVKVTAMALMEGADLLGCQAGFSFLYVGTDGAVCPCDFVPISFGNVYKDGLRAVLRRLAEQFPEPCTNCLGAQVRRTAGPDATSRIPREQGRGVLDRLDADGHARLMKTLLPRRRGKH